jgi:ribosomal protein S21
MINVEITKQGTENTMGTIRRFTKRVQGSGVLRRARSIRYFKRNESNYVKKSQALNRIQKREKYQELVKLGKIAEGHRRGRGRRR